MTLLERGRRQRDEAKRRPWLADPSLDLARIYEHAAAIGAQGALALESPESEPGIAG